MVSRTQPHVARLPAPDPGAGGHVGERLRGAAALVAILLLVAGAPWALWTFGGVPWPSTAPGLDWLTQPVGPEVVLRVLVIVLWVAWVHFVVCLLAEIRTERRGAGLPLHVPGGAVGTQPLARRLVASVLLLAGSASVTVPAAAAVSGSGAHETVTASTVTASTVTGSEARSGTRAGSAQSDRMVGRTAEAPRVAADGRRITYTVQPPHGRHYDSLWDIAERFLGDGRRYKEIYDLNKGKLQADGRTLREADLIHPGWVMALPDDAKGPGLDITEAQAPPPRPSGSQRGAGSTSQIDADDPASDPAASGSAASESAASEAIAGADASPGTSLVQYGVGGAMVAAGLLAGLIRRRGWNGGGEDALSPEEEMPMRLAADDRQARFVDRALRGLAHALQLQGRAMPSVYAAYLNGDVLSLALSPAVAQGPPPGWYGDDEGRMWSIERQTVESLRTPAEILAPYPGLVTVGALDDGTLVLLELETAPGLVSLGGHLESAREVGVSLAVELATNLWSDDVAVTLVGFGDDLTELAPHRVRRIDHVDAMLDDLEQLRSKQQAACAHSGLDSVIRGRQTRPDRGLWKPHFIVLSGVPTQEQLVRLAELAADPRQAIGVVTIGDAVTAPWRMVVSEDGRLTNQLLGLDVEAQRLTVGAYTKVLELFRRADAEDRIDPTALEPAAVPGLDARLLDLEQPAAVRVQLLGGIRVDAPGELDAERRELATEIVAYVALHPEGVHPGVLDSAIWPRGVTDEVRNAAIGHVQRWLGENAGSGRPRLDADDQGHWRLDLSSVRVDWHVFQALLDRAHRGGDPANDLALALSMLRGPALGELPARRYSWLAHSTHLRDINVTVVEAARQLGELAAGAEDPAFAREVLRTGLLVVPACEELWRDLLRVTARFDSREETASVVDAMYVAISEHGSPRGASAETDALVDELVPGYRRWSA